MAFARENKLKVLNSVGEELTHFSTASTKDFLCCYPILNANFLSNNVQSTPSNS